MAIQYYDRAARSKDGHPTAAYELARLYLQGNSLEGIAKDLVKAEEYAQLGIRADATNDFDKQHHQDLCRSLLNVVKSISQIDTNKKSAPGIGMS